MIYDKLDIERGYYTTKSCIDDNLRYTEYYGDGDTKSFSGVENVYGEKNCNKT